MSQPVRVHVSNASRASSLARSLVRFSPEIRRVGRASAIDATVRGLRPSPVPELLPAIREWLVEQSLDAVSVEIDSDPCMVRAGASRRRERLSAIGHGTASDLSASRERGRRQ